MKSVSHGLLREVGIWVLGLCGPQIRFLGLQLGLGELGCCYRPDSMLINILKAAGGWLKRKYPSEHSFVIFWEANETGSADENLGLSFLRIFFLSYIFFLSAHAQLQSQMKSALVRQGCLCAKRCRVSIAVGLWISRPWMKHFLELKVIINLTTYIKALTFFFLLPGDSWLQP